MGHGGVLLLAEAGRGESLTAREIVRRYQRRIYSVLYRMVGHHADVEDLCQETFLQLLRNSRGMAEAREPEAWVYRVAMNVAIDHLRRKVRERGLADKAAGRAPEPKPPTPAESESAARQALDALEPQLRQVAILRIFEGLSHEQISAVLDAPVGTIRWRLFEARRKLGDLLGPYLREMKEDQR